MSKLKQALIPGYGANPTKPNSNPLSGLAPDPETGLPKGLPSGVGKIALRASNPVGGFAPDINGDIGYQKGWLDQSSNGTPDAAPKGPGYNVWADPDMTARGWGWGMGADGALHEGVHGGGPAGTPWGPQGSQAAPQATGQAASNLGQLGQTIAGGMHGIAGGPGGLPRFGQALAQGIRQFNANGGMGAAPGLPQQGPQGPQMAQQGMPPGVSQPAPGLSPQMGGAGMPPMPAQQAPQANPQAYAQLIAQMRQQQSPQSVA
jgi:hypothetical protein